MSLFHCLLSVLCLVLVIVSSSAAKVPFSRLSSSLTTSSLLDNTTVQVGVAAQAGLTGSSSSFGSSEHGSWGAETSSTGAAPRTIGAGQAFITLALILLVVAAVMGAVWYRHRQRGDGAAAFSFTMPSFRRSRTHGSGAVGGGANNERLLAGQASDDGGLLRNRPGGHSLV